tara:strand:- start:96128 stop:97069 length:942 start_codon:yes stop_codon:yes gene_type:complete
MFEQLKQLFWAAFGSPEPTPDFQGIDLTADDGNEVIPLSFDEYEQQYAHTSRGSDTLQALCCLYRENVHVVHRLLRPLFPSKSLGDSSWLDDDCINDYLEALVSDYARQGLKVAFVSSQKANPGTNGFIIERLNRKGRGRYKKDEAALTAADLIFCPVNLLGNHWGLWVLDRRAEQNHQIYGLDGFNSNPFVEHSEDSYAAHQAIYYKKYIMPLAKIFGVNASNAHHHYIPRQGNNIDCGAVVCYWAKQICDKERDINSPIDSDFDSKNYTAFRLDIAKTILSSHPGSAEKRAAPGAQSDDETPSRASKKARI